MYTRPLIFLLKIKLLISLSRLEILECCKWCQVWAIVSSRSWNEWGRDLQPSLGPHVIFHPEKAMGWAPATNTIAQLRAQGSGTEGTWERKRTRTDHLHVRTPKPVWRSNDSPKALCPVGGLAGSSLPPSFLTEMGFYSPAIGLLYSGVLRTILMLKEAPKYDCFIPEPYISMK